MGKYFSKLIGSRMMLCTRNIKAGDEIYLPEINEYHKFREYSTNNGGSIICESLNGQHYEEFAYQSHFRIIGEISPEAKWIKEGDEFEEDQIRIDMIDRKFPSESHYDIEDLELTNAIFIKNRPDRFYISIAVECPCCKTFK